MIDESEKTIDESEKTIDESEKMIDESEKSDEIDTYITCAVCSQ